MSDSTFSNNSPQAPKRAAANQADVSLRELQHLASDPSERESLQPDAELLTLYVEGGSHEAISTLIRRYAPMVASVCRLTVSDPASAEDAFQATFLILLKSAKKIRKRASVGAWLHGVAYRAASRIRQTVPSASFSERTENDVIAEYAPEDDPLSQVARKMELEVLDRELENLPDKLRGPLVEHYLLGYSAPEIAQRMELSTAAVEGRLKRGRSKLRTLLARRGISLAVLVSGSTLFQQSLQATEAAAWTDSFLAEHQLLNSGANHVPEKTPEPSGEVAPQVSSLIRQETAMLSTTPIKAGLAASIILVAGTLAVLASDPRQYGQGDGKWSQGSNLDINAREVENMDESSIVAQFGGAVGDTQAGGGLGGGPGVATFGNASAGAQPPPAPEPALWQRPDATSSEMPAWLTGGSASIQAKENMRSALSIEVNFDFAQVPLQEVISSLAASEGIQLEINQTELDLLGVDPDVPITAMGRGNLRELFRRILQPLELTYRVNESTIEITSLDHAENHPSIRYYDLAYILPNSSNAESLVLAIESSISPDQWVASGGSGNISVVGSMMIVSTTEVIHQQIEVMLINVAKMNPKNVEKATSIYSSGFSSNNFGGGMGGMGGGGMGGGGGMF